MKNLNSLIITLFSFLLVIIVYVTHPTHTELVSKIEQQVLEYCKTNVPEDYQMYNNSSILSPSFEMASRINKEILGNEEDLYIEDLYIFQEVQTEGTNYPNLKFVFGKLINGDELEQQIIQDIEKNRLPK